MKTALKLIAASLVLGTAAQGYSSAMLRDHREVCEGIGRASSMQVTRTTSYSHCINWGGEMPCEPATTVIVTTTVDGEILAVNDSVAETVQRTSPVFSKLGCIAESAWVEKIQMLPLDGTEARAWEGLFACSTAENLCIAGGM